MQDVFQLVPTALTNFCFYFLHSCIGLQDRVCDRGWRCWDHRLAIYGFSSIITINKRPLLRWGSLWLHPRRYCWFLCLWVRPVSTSLHSIETNKAISQLLKLSVSHILILCLNFRNSIDILVGTNSQDNPDDRGQPATYGLSDITVVRYILVWQ